MSEPAWAAPARQFVPLHLTPGSTRSSFARPDDYKLPQHIHSTVGGSSPPQRPRSNFASKPKSKSKRLGQLDTPEDELPPTLSIRGTQKPVFGELEAESSGLQPVPAATLVTSSKANVSTSKPSVSSSNFKIGYPVNIYGFPPGCTGAVLQHFGKFGEIIETAGDSGVSTAAIECGRNWVRITYRDRQGAAAALAQDGVVMPGQYMIGCQLAEPMEAGGLTHQSSTNSLLIDDSDVSILQDQSMVSVLHEDSVNKEGNSSTAKNESIRRSGSVHGSIKGVKNDQDRGDYSIGQIVPLEMTGQLFKQPAPAKHRQVEQNITKVEEPSGYQGFLGKAYNKVTDMLFGWDL